MEIDASGEPPCTRQCGIILRGVAPLCPGRCALGAPSELPSGSKSSCIHRFCGSSYDAVEDQVRLAEEAGGLCTSAGQPCSTISVTSHGTSSNLWTSILYPSVYLNH